jgi:hypothetical protein
VLYLPNAFSVMPLMQIVDCISYSLCQCSKTLLITKLADAYHDIFSERMRFETHNVIVVSTPVARGPLTLTLQVCHAACLFCFGYTGMQWTTGIE